MRIKTKAILLMALIIAGVSSAFAIDHVKGNGKLTTKKISIADFNEVRVDGVIDFTYEQSDAPSAIEVTVDQNLHQYVDIEVKDRVLNIGFRGAKVDHYTKFIVKTNSKWLSEAKITGNANFMVESKLEGDETTIKATGNSLVQLKKNVNVGKLELNVAGSANMVLEQLKADEVECDIDGSGTITIKSGDAKVGKYSIVGGGDIHAFGLAVPDLTCKLTGNGLAEVHATDNLKANVIGKGNIRYKGPTAVQQKVIGKGTVEEVK